LDIFGTYLYWAVDNGWSMLIIESGSSHIPGKTQGKIMIKPSCSSGGWCIFYWHQLSLSSCISASKKDLSHLVAPIRHGVLVLFRSPVPRAAHGGRGKLLGAAMTNCQNPGKSNSISSHY
jgi:hypothetical protein